MTKIIFNEFPTIAHLQPVAIDTELFGMTKLHRPTGQFASMQMCCNENEVYIITEQSLVEGALNSIRHGLPIFHNASFDLRQLRRWASFDQHSFPNGIVDIMLIDKILWSGYYEGFSLKDLSRRYLSLYLNKTEREEFVTRTELSPEMIEYAAQDAVCTLRIWQEQEKLMSPRSWHVWRDIDSPAMWAILDMMGFRLDVDGWLQMAMENSSLAAQLKQSFPFNPDSPKQVLTALRDSGLSVESTGEEVLSPYRTSSKLVSNLLDYRRAAKSASTYGEAFVLENVEPDGRIYASFNVSQAETGRMSCSNPNLQNIPNSREFRSKFIPSNGNVLVIADYSAQEPRITAWHSQDTEMLRIVRSGQDIHLLVGRVMFRDETMVKSDPRRKKAKALNLGLIYGLTAQGLARKLNEAGEHVSEEEAESLVKSYFRAFPKIKDYMDTFRQTAQTNGYVDTKSGRRVWVNLYGYHWKNNAINAPIQGGAADMTKMALSILHDRCYHRGNIFPVVAVVHDEIVLDVPEVDQHFWAEEISACMSQAGQEIYDGIPFTADVSIGNSWAEKH